MTMRAHYRTPPADDVIPLDSLTGRDSRWTQRAVGVALTSQHPFPMGALAVSGGSLIGHAVNRYRNSPRVVDWEECSTHAEAALAARTDLDGAAVYVARILADGAAAMAKPCVNCLHTLTAAGARRVMWTDGEENAGCLSLG